MFKQIKFTAGSHGYSPLNASTNMMYGYHRSIMKTEF